MSKINDVRINKGLTQKYMAKKLGIAVSTYNQYENAIRSIPVNTANKISSILGVKNEDIFLPIKFTISK